MDYHRVLVGTQYIMLGNDTQKEILGVGSYQLKMKNDKSLLLKHVMYATRVQCNLLSRQEYSFSFFMVQV